VSFQTNWLKHFSWLSYSFLLESGICRHCILSPTKFPKEQHQEYWSPHLSKIHTLRHRALGKDGVLNCYEQSLMHKYATEQADLFKQTFESPDKLRVDSQMARSEGNQVKQNE